jgi:hypothetical protein
VSREHFYFYLKEMEFRFNHRKAANLAAFALYFAYYNFCRIHQSLRCTPAMEAGVARRIWELRDLIRGGE